MDINDLVRTYQSYLFEMTHDRPSDERLKEMKDSNANEFFAYLAEERPSNECGKEDYERSGEYTILDEMIADQLNENYISSLGGTWALFDQL